MAVELVRVTTSDRIRLHGAYQPADDRTTPMKRPALILVSGVGSNFYGSTLLETMANRLASNGFAVLRINTRGHDHVSLAATDGQPKLQGAAYEKVDECRHDLRAWTDMLKQQGHDEVVWVGHSLGALKVLYAQACESETNVSRVIAISPPRLQHQSLASHASGFVASFQEAKRLAEDGKGQTLFKSQFPFPMLMSADTFLDKYGPGDRYDVTAFTSRVSVPMLFLFGQAELTRTNVPFFQLPEELQRLPNANRMSIETVPEANHFYRDKEDELTTRVQRWLESD